MILRDRRVLAALVSLAAVAGCRARAAADDAASTDAANAAAVVIRLERGACYGRCAEYVVEVSANGAVRFEGRKNVQQLGEQRSSIAASAVQALQQQFAEAGFATADSAYTEGSPRCGQFVPDGPRSRLSAVVGGTLKSVQLDGGCTDAPRFLNILATQVDNVARTSVWVTGTGENTP